MPPAKTKAKGKLEFFVDPRLELDGVMELLAFERTKGAGGKPHATDFMHPDIEYVRAARDVFKPFIDHPAIKRRAEPGFRAFDLGQRGQGLMRLSPLPEFAPHSQISIAFLSHYVGGDAQLDLFLQDMRDFARDSKFMEFFEKKTKLLDADLAKLKAEIEKSDYIGKIEKYTGLPFEGRYAFVLSPFIASDTGANIVQRGEDGLADIISVLGPIEPPAPDGPLVCTYHRLHARIWHEAAHGVMDNVTELYGLDIAAKQPPPRKEATREYQNWMHHVREHMVRTIMLRLVSREISESFSDQELQHEEDCGLPFLREFKARMAEYEGDRKKYPTIADFYPRLIDCLPAPKGKPRPLDRENDHYRDWITENAMPFYTEPQRRRALWYLDLMLARSKNPGLLLKRASLRFLLGDREAAVKDAETVLAASPKDEGALLIKKTAAGGPAPQSSGSPAHAPSPSSKAVEKAPPGRENPVERPAELKRLNSEGMKAFLKGKRAAALKSFEAALSLAPDDSESLVNAAIVHAQTGDEKKAMPLFEKAIAMCLAIPSPQSRAAAAAAMSSRATLHERAKRNKDAKADLEKALQLAPPEWAERAAAEKRLKGLA